MFKAFVKIGLTLMPETELGPFQPALDWIYDDDHRRSFVKELTIFHTFENGPMRPDQLAAFILRRKPGVSDAPYAILVLAYGNEVFQVPIPAPEEDSSLNGRTFSFMAFPTPGGMDPDQYGRARPKPINLAGRDVVKGEVINLAMRYETLVAVPTSSGSSPP